MTLESLRENFRRFTELAEREWPYLAETENWSMWDEPMLRMVSEGLPEAFRVAPSPMVDRWCQAYLEQNGAPCRCYLCQPVGDADNITDEVMAWSNRIEAAPPLTLERLREGMQALERLRDEWQPWPKLTLTDPDVWFLIPDEPMTVPPLTNESERRAWSEAGFAQALRDMASWDGIPCPCTLCESGQGADNVTEELMALVRSGDEAGFRELAGCVMPAGEVDECWAGARRRLGLPGPPPDPSRGVQEIAEIMRPLVEWAEGLG